MAADSTVRLLVDARSAISGLRRTNQETKKLEGAVRDMNGRLADSKGRFVSVGRSATTASKGVNTLTRSVKGLLGAFTAIQTAKFVFFKTAQLETQTRSLQVLTGSLETAKGVISELQQFAAVTPFTSTELVETAKRLKAFGIETKSLVDTTKRLGDVAGATGAELDGIATAFGQIRAKGKLQQEENLQLLERGVDLTSELRKMYGLSGEELAKAMSKGQISFDAANEALRRMTDTGGKYANGAIAQSDTLAGKFSTLTDGIESIARTIGDTISPALKIILDQAIGVINSINAAVAAARRIQEFGISADERGRLFKKAGEQAQEIALLRGGGTLDPAEFTRLRAERYKDLIEDFGFRTGQIAPEITAPATQQGAVPGLLTGGGSGSGAGAAAKKEEAERLRILKERQQIMIQINEQELDARAAFEGDLEKLGQRNRLLQAKLDGNEDEVRLQERINELAEKHEGFDISSLENLVKKGEELRNEIKLSEELEQQQQQAAERLGETYRTIGDAIKTGVVDSLTAAVEGTKSLADVAMGTLKSLAQTLLKMSINNLLGGLGGGNPASIFTKLFGGGRANGGSVSGGTSYLVGEKGPELFTPGRSGSIAPNKAMGGANVVVNVDASGTNAQGDGQNAKQLGQVIGAAVQAELIKQQRPGGLLAN